MKKLFLFLSLFIGVVIFSQETTEQKQSDIAEKVDKAPEFPTGFNGFRKKIAENFRTKEIKERGKLSCIVKFVVEKDGTISIVKVDGTNENFNKEAVRAIMEIKEKWSPAKVKGEIVRSMFTVPIAMIL